MTALTQSPAAAAHPRNTWIGIIAVAILVPVTVGLAMRTSGVAVSDRPAASVATPEPTLPSPGSDAALQRSARIWLGHELSPTDLAALRGLPPAEAEWRLRELVEARIRRARTSSEKLPTPNDLRHQVAWGQPSPGRKFATGTITNGTKWSIVDLVVVVDAKARDLSLIATRRLMLDEIPAGRSYTWTVEIPATSETFGAGLEGGTWAYPPEPY